MPQPSFLLPKRGNFYTYRIVKPTDLHKIKGKSSSPNPPYAVDLGFATRIDLKLGGIKNPWEGQIIESVQTKLKPGVDRYRFKKSSAGGETLYTYNATVERIIDGDTLWMQVDLGFRVWTRQKLRLRGINTKELGIGGEKAQRFVRKTLAQVPFVVIKVTSPDKFGRYLTDLFYLKMEENPEKILAEGVFLNQELLEKGFAVRLD